VVLDREEPGRVVVPEVEAERGRRVILVEEVARETGTNPVDDPGLDVIPGLTVVPPLTTRLLPMEGREPRSFSSSVPLRFRFVNPVVDGSTSFSFSTAATISDVLDLVVVGTVVSVWEDELMTDLAGEENSRGSFETGAGIPDANGVGEDVRVFMLVGCNGRGMVDIWWW
jgi:hypothetical protein